jgi:hypothetical protein
LYAPTVADRWPLVCLLLLAATFFALVQSWRLGRMRLIAQVYRAAGTREQARRVTAHARSLRASDGERLAFELLERSGYTVLEHQVAGSWTLRADGQPITFGLRADFIVTRAGRRYIAEVKTGRLAPRLSHGPTRRQLLEYKAAFDVHGVILVDADAGMITHVDVDDTAVRGGSIWARGMAIVAVVCFSAGAIVGAAVAGAAIGK